MKLTLEQLSRRYNNFLWKTVKNHYIGYSIKEKIWIGIENGQTKKEEWRVLMYFGVQLDTAMLLLINRYPTPFSTSQFERKEETLIYSGEMISVESILSDIRKLTPEDKIELYKNLVEDI